MRKTKNNEDSEDKIESFNALNNEQKNIITKKKISASKTVEEWLLLLEDVALFDEVVNINLSKKNMLKGVFLLFASIILFFPILIIVNEVVAVSLPVITSVYVAYCYVKLKKWVKKDVSNQLGEFVVPFIRLIKDDIKNKTIIDMSLNLQDLDEMKATHKDKNKSKGYPKISTEYFQNTWFELHAILADKTHLHIKIIDDVRRLKIRKKIEGRKTKYKTKRKYKIRRFISARMSFNSANYDANMELLASKKNKVSISHKEEKSSLKIRSREKIDNYKAVDVYQVLELVSCGLGVLDRKKQEDYLGVQPD